MCSGIVEPLLVAQARQQPVDADDVVGVAREGRAEHGGDADRVLVEVRLDVLGADRELVRLQRDDPRLDVEVAAELLPHDVHVAAEHQVRPVGGLAGGLAPLAPLPLQRQGAEHDRLGGALGARAGRLAGRVVEVGEHPDAALLDHGRLRVLGVIDVVAVQVLGDHPLRLGLHPCGDEGRQVAERDAVEHHLLADEPHRVGSRHADLGETVVGRVAARERVAVELRRDLEGHAGDHGSWRGGARITRIGRRGGVRGRLSVPRGARSQAVAACALGTRGDRGRRRPRASPPRWLLIAQAWLLAALIAGPERSRSALAALLAVVLARAVLAGWVRRWWRAARRA